MSLTIRRRVTLRAGRGFALRRMFPLHWRAVRPKPVVALFAEWHQQGIPETIVLTQGIAGNSDDHLVLRNGAGPTTERRYRSSSCSPALRVSREVIAWLDAAGKNAQRRTKTQNRYSDERRRKIFHLSMIYTSAPRQEEPEPAVQPKQWLSVAIGRPSRRSGSRSHRKSGAPFFHSIPSCWLKSQS
jgi:hypothetical protein